MNRTTSPIRRTMALLLTLLTTMTMQQVWAQNGVHNLDGNDYPTQHVPSSKYDSDYYGHGSGRKSKQEHADEVVESVSQRMGGLSPSEEKAARDIAQSVYEHLFPEGNDAHQNGEYDEERAQKIAREISRQEDEHTQDLTKSIISNFHFNSKGDNCEGYHHGPIDQLLEQMQQVMAQQEAEQ